MLNSRQIFSLGTIKSNHGVKIPEKLKYSNLTAYKSHAVSSQYPVKYVSCGKENKHSNQHISDLLEFSDLSISRNV